MWDDVPYIQALIKAAHPAVRQEHALADFIRRCVLQEGQRRPWFLHEIEGGVARQPCGFIYDRSSGLLFLGCPAVEDHAAAALMQLHALRSQPHWPHVETALSKRVGQLAEQYVEEGFGFIGQPPRNGASQRWCLQVGQDVLLSASEQLSFADLEVCPQ